MVSNFKIRTHQNNGYIHLNLSGDFDGTSAYQLIDAIKKVKGTAETIIIHTDRLVGIHPFGLHLFQHECGLANLSHSLIFTGDIGNLMVPVGSQSVKPAGVHYGQRNGNHIFTTFRQENDRMRSQSMKRTRGAYYGRYHQNNYRGTG